MSKIRLRWYVYATALLAVSGSVHASGRFEVSGYFKNFSIAYDLPHPAPDDLPVEIDLLGSVSNRLRLDGRWKATDWLTVEGSYNLVPRVQDRLLFFDEVFGFGIDPYGYRFDDLDRRLYPEDAGSISSFAVYQNLDRAYVRIRLPAADLYAGRQAVAWGTARVVNPTDVIAPYGYTELDTENRVGVDAVRVRYPLGFMGEIDIGYVFGEDFEFANSAAFVRGKYYLAKTDVSAVAVAFRENLLVGLNLARSIGGAGAWLEAGQVFVDGLAGDDGDGRGGDYFRLSAGVDYSLTGELYGFVEYHYNQAGSNEATDYLGSPAGPGSSTAYREGAVYLLGEHYAIPGASYQITPLITGSVEALVNLGDPSVLLSPYAEYNIAQNVYVSAGAFVGLGDGPDLAEALEDVERVLKSEFGSYPDMYYTSIRLYF